MGNAGHQDRGMEISFLSFGRISGRRRPKTGLSAPMIFCLPRAGKKRFPLNPLRVPPGGLFSRYDNRGL
jgi:hypothetical protein